MPELPEVTTTVEGLSRVLPGKQVVAVWTDLGRKRVSLPHHRQSLKDAGFMREFERRTVGAKVSGVRRRAKNILIDLSNQETVLIHMKMTGHLLWGAYAYDEKQSVWAPDPNEKNQALRDPFNKFLHAVFSFDNGKQLALSDMRKFATVTVLPTKDVEEKFKGIGPEPLEDSFDYRQFKERLAKKPSGKIKQVLMDQTVIAGIGNIYSDEMLWLAGIHPESKAAKIPEAALKKLFSAMKAVLRKGIDFGGDSTSDYRDIYGERGAFQSHHNAYRLTGKPCLKRGCSGAVARTIVGGRSAHFCSAHQMVYK